MKKILCAMLLLLMIIPCGILFSGCGDQASHNYNIIMCKATNPASLAVMDAVENGNSTYIWLERGSSYTQLLNGNYGQFVKSTGWGTTSEALLTSNVVNDIRDRMLNISAKDSEAYFNIYVRDMDVLYAYQLVAESQLEEGSYKIILGEDGSALYNGFNARYVTGKSCVGENDEPYEQLESDITAFETVLASINESTYNFTIDAADTIYQYVFAAATRDEVELWYQTPTSIKNALDANANIADSKIYESMGQKTAEAETICVNLVEKLTTQMYSDYTQEKKELYQLLTLGASDSTRVKDLFSRSTKDSLVIAGTSITSMAGLNLVADYTDLSQLDATLTALAGYNKITTSSDKLVAYNQFIEYKTIFTAIYNIYGEEYDILYKDHPRCGPEEGKLGNWTNRYGIKGEWLYNMVRDFFTNNAIGKEIGILPSGVSIDNFLSFGYNFKVAGWDSTFYPNFPEDSTLFLITTSYSANYMNFNTTKAYMNEGEKHDNVITWNGYKVRQLLNPTDYNYYTVDRLGNVSVKVEYTTDGGTTWNEVFVPCGTALNTVAALQNNTWFDAATEGNAVTSTPVQTATINGPLKIYSQIV